MRTREVESNIRQAQRTIEALTRKLEASEERAKKLENEAADQKLRLDIAQQKLETGRYRWSDSPIPRPGRKGWWCRRYRIVSKNGRDVWIPSWIRLHKMGGYAAKQEAKETLAKLSNRRPKPQNLTLSGLAAAYVDSIASDSRSRVRLAGLRRYSAIARLVIKYIPGDLSLASFNQGQEKNREALKAALENPTTLYGTPATGPTIHSRFIGMTTLFAWAVEQGLIKPEDNPMKGIPRPQMGVTKGNVTWPIEFLREVIEITDRESPWLADLVALCWGTGLRPISVLRLTWREVNLRETWDATSIKIIDPKQQQRSFCLAVSPDGFEALRRARERTYREVGVGRDILDLPVVWTTWGDGRKGIRLYIDTIPGRGQYREAAIEDKGPKTGFMSASDACKAFREIADREENGLASKLRDARAKENKKDRDGIAEVAPQMYHVRKAFQSCLATIADIKAMKDYQMQRKGADVDLACYTGEEHAPTLNKCREYLAQMPRIWGSAEEPAQKVQEA